MIIISSIFIIIIINLIVNCDESKRDQLLSPYTMNCAIIYNNYLYVINNKLNTNSYVSIVSYYLKKYRTHNSLYYPNNRHLEF